MANNLPVQIDQNVQVIATSLKLAEQTIYKTYLERLNSFDIVSDSDSDDSRNLSYNDNIRLFKVDRFVFDKNENNRDKLVSVFHAVASCGGSIIILVHSDGKEISFYFGTKHLEGQDKVKNSAETLKKTLKGNFPGTQINDAVKDGEEKDKLFGNVFLNNEHKEQKKQICTVTGIAGLRSKEESHEKQFVQGIEKLFESMQGQSYSLLLIADPVSNKQIERIKHGYENHYSQFVPLSGSEINYSENKNESISNGFAHSTSKSISKNISDTLSYTEGTSKSHTNSTSDSFYGGVNVGFGIPGIFSIGGGGGSSHGSGRADQTGSQKSTSSGTIRGQAVATAENQQISGQQTEGVGKGLGLQLKFENKRIKNLLDKINIQLERIDASKDIGMWNCSLYCLADDLSTCRIAASAYQSLLRGENSSIETGIITEWSEEKAVAILPYLKNMQHPILNLNPQQKITITPSSLISSAELTIHAGIPQKSVSGLPVLEMAAFGREVVTHWDSFRNTDGKDKIEIGKTYHMGNTEELPVALDKKSLASHTFITGSTGSGKSNTVYQLLSKLSEPSDIKKSVTAFLVIEPAKGEYKNVFGSSDKVSVYGTNPELTPLLRINPFSFPNGDPDPSKNIHILEHLDRLVEIFNVCWPMYAAMPAVLKDAIEAAYEGTGWDLGTSTNCYKTPKYPAFTDVVSHIRTIIDDSEYSDENKGNYKGSLITRLKSLTNGINGMIFTKDELSKEILFDNNVIVDLSRVGAMETKALIMGLLVMKLQEYRMTSGRTNADLQHVTVLEEAHNLLKRTSTEQSSESSNLLGKSVEMLANAIAEMRTYGEGYIIVDQAPGLLDMSVIRNTNTKIILRLPDESDRVLVGKAAGLTDDQIVEIAKLQCGVAAVYQNDWLEPVLCKVDEFKDTKKAIPYKNHPDKKSLDKTNSLNQLKRLSYGDATVGTLKEIVEGIDIADFKAAGSETILRLFKNNGEIVNAAYCQVREQQTGRLQGLYGHIMQHLEPDITNLPQEHQRFILSVIIDEACKTDGSSEFPRVWRRFLETEVR